MVDPVVPADGGDVDPAPTGRVRLPRPSKGWVVLVVACLIVYVAVLMLYARSGRNEGFEAAGPPPAKGIEVSFNLTDLNASAGRLIADVTITPGDALLSKDEVSPSQDVELVLAPVTGSQQLHFPRGQVPATVQVQVLLDGEIESWPFDRYDGVMVLQAFQVVKGEPQALPMSVSVGGHVKGWRSSVQPTLSESESRLTGQQILTVHMSRSGGTLTFAVIMIAVLITLPVLSLFVTYEVLRGRRKAEPAFAGWIAAMLFASVALRNYLPGSPPAGSWIDVTVVLWVIVGLVFSLVLYVIAWWRNGRPETVADAAPAPADRGHDGP